MKTTLPRRRTYSCLAAALAIFLLLPSLPLRAALIETIQPSVVSTNSNGNAFDITLTNTGPSSVAIAAFSFGIQANNSNVAFTFATIGTVAAPYIFAGNSLFGPNITTSTGSAPPSITASDMTAGAAVVIGPGVVVGLGHIIFNAGALTGFTTLTFQAPNTTLTSSSGASIPIDGFVPGTVLVNGPSPAPDSGSSAFLLLLGMVALSLVPSLLGSKATA